jgi:signal peptidase II
LGEARSIGLSTAGAWRGAIATCASVVVADQATKQIAVDELAGRSPVDLPLGFELDYLTNTGIAFGLLDQGEGLVIAITLAALALLLTWFSRDPARRGLWPAVGLLAGGALGNLADRIRDGAVIDFVDPPNWPAFNLADVAITIGVALLLVAYWRGAD